MRFARNSYITWFSKLSFRVYFRKPFRDLPDTFRDAAFSFFFVFVVFFMFSIIIIISMVAKQALTLEWQLFGKCSFWIPSGFLPDLTRD